MNEERRRAAEVGRAFQRELTALLGLYVTDKVGGHAQTSILATLMAEAVRGACETGLTEETVHEAVRSMYAEHAKARKP